MPEQKVKFTEQQANMWDFYGKPDTAVFITTNGTVKTNKNAVMGKGNAKEAQDKFLNLATILGEALSAAQDSKQPLTVMWVKEHGIGTFPVKHNWYDKADIKLIEQSCRGILSLAGMLKWKTIVLPRPGCGNGGLNWEEEVKPILAKYLDERFIIVNK